MPRSSGGGLQRGGCPSGCLSPFRRAAGPAKFWKFNFFRSGENAARPGLREGGGGGGGGRARPVRALRLGEGGPRAAGALLLPCRCRAEGCGRRAGPGGVPGSRRGRHAQHCAETAPPLRPRGERAPKLPPQISSGGICGLRGAARGRGGKAERGDRYLGTAAGFKPLVCVLP